MMSRICSYRRMRRSRPSFVYDSSRIEADGVTATLRTLAAENIRSTGVVSGVTGRLMEHCLQRMRTL
jgi:hypothetical protein